MPNQPLSARRIVGAALFLALSTAAVSATHSPDRSQTEAVRTSAPVIIDGRADDVIWESAQWRDIGHRWLGPEYSQKDFKGRFKVAWSKDKLYILAEIHDDVLRDSHRHPLKQYWDDDCLEIFIDEDYSGGDHQFNHNAFAYHMSLDNQAIDIGTNKQAQNYSHHVESQWKQVGDTLVWELAIDIYDDSYIDSATSNTPVQLAAGKILGLMVAYCDNDASELRENFIGSESVPSGPKDRGWIDAGLFGELKLVN